MSGAKLTAMILFGALAFVFTYLFTVGLTSAATATLSGIVAAAATCALIWFAQTGKHAFARGFLALGAVFICVPVAGLGQWGEEFAASSLQAVETGAGLSDEDYSQFVLTSIFASAGVVLGLVVGAILVLIGALMHRKPRATA
jgi:hypothetical protein